MRYALYLSLAAAAVVYAGPECSPPTAAARAARPARDSETKVALDLPRYDLPRYDLPRYDLPRYDLPRYKTIADVKEAVLGLTDAGVWGKLGAPKQIVSFLDPHHPTRLVWNYRLPGGGAFTVWIESGVAYAVTSDDGKSF
jgi:hypothetical protein